MCSQLSFLTCAVPLQRSVVSSSVFLGYEFDSTKGYPGEGPPAVVRRSARRAGQQPEHHGGFDGPGGYWAPAAAPALAQQPPPLLHRGEPLLDVPYYQPEAAEPGPLPVADEAGAEQHAVQLEADYVAVLEADAEAHAEAVRRDRVAIIVQQQLEEAVRPLLERECAICMSALGDESDGPVIRLDCHHTHCFHAGCLASAWAAQPGQRCPVCRASHPSTKCTVAGASEWQTARQAEQRRLSDESDEQRDWQALPPAQKVAPPTARVPPAPAQHVAGEWHAIDSFSVIDCVISPCAHVLDVPTALRLDWARARTEVFDEITAARQSGDDLRLERALKWHLCLHDVLLRGPRRGTRGSTRMTGHLESRFEAWRHGRRERLLQWWNADRARGWLRARTRAQRSPDEDAEDQRRQQAEEALNLIRDGELSRAMRLLHSLGIAGLSERWQRLPMVHSASPLCRRGFLQGF